MCVVAYAVCVPQRHFPKGNPTTTTTATTTLRNANGQGSLTCSQQPLVPLLYHHVRLSLVIDELLHIWSINAFLSFFSQRKIYGVTLALTSDYWQLEVAIVAETETETWARPGGVLLPNAIFI